MKKVAIVMGSDSDLPVAQKAVDTLKAFDVPFEAHVFSAHRTPDQARDFARSAREKGFGVIVAAAGMAAHLAGAIAANTTLPVIGIPCRGGALDGLDALLSTVQMPSGIPVATVALNGGANAALLAVEILAVEDGELAKKLADKRRTDAENVLKKDAAGRRAGAKAGGQAPDRRPKRAEKGRGPFVRAAIDIDKSDKENRL